MQTEKLIEAIQEYCQEYEQGGQTTSTHYYHIFMDLLEQYEGVIDATV